MLGSISEMHPLGTSTFPARSYVSETPAGSLADKTRWKGVSTNPQSSPSIVEVSGYTLGNKLRKLSTLQLSLEKMAPPQACICLQFHPTTDQLGPCLWGSLACSQTAKSAFAKHVSASKSLCSLNWSHRCPSYTLGMPRKLLPGMASHVGIKKCPGPRTWAETPPNDAVCTRKQFLEPKLCK